MVVFTGVLSLIVVAAAALTWVGVRTVRESRTGRSVSTVTDPALPGFEAFLEPTPTLLVLHVEDGILASAALLTLRSGDEGGSVVVLPPGTHLGPEEDALRLDVIVAFGQEPTDLRPIVQGLLGIGIAEVVVVDDARWESLLQPVGTLTIANPDAVGDFPAGELALTPDQVPAYLTALGDGESEMARLFRQQLVYEAWAAAVAASDDPAVVPGEVDSGIGRFVRGLASGPRQLATLPVDEVEPDGEGPVRLNPAQEALEELIASAVPFPTASQPGARVRVRLLDGTGDPDHVLRTAPAIVPADAEIVVVGNADRFDYGATEIRYHVPERQGAAEAVRTALGAGRVIDDPRQTDAFDVTIVLGPDV